VLSKSAVRAPREGVTTSTHRVASNLVTPRQIAPWRHVTHKAKLMPTALRRCIEAEASFGTGQTAFSASDLHRD